MSNVNSKNLSFLGSASTFIKDHGVAIFLVVFFVVVIYPEQAKERKEWITQITELQDSLDPAKRPMSPDQASIILDLVTEVFIQSIESTMQTELIARQRGAFYGSSYGTGGFNGKEVSLTLLNEEFKIELDRNIEEQVTEEYSRYQRLIKRRELTLRQEASIALEKAVRSAKYATSGLRSFVYSEGTLSDIWDSAFSVTYNNFSKSLIESYSNSAKNEFTQNEFIKFIESAEGNVPEKLLEIDEHKTPSLVIFEFRKQVRASWKSFLYEQK